MEDFKNQIANAISESLEHDYIEYKVKNKMATNNNLRYARSDIINEKLTCIFSDPEKYNIIYFKRGSWNMIFVLNLISKSIVSITTNSNLEAIRNRENNTHYMQEILLRTNNDISADKQLYFFNNKIIEEDISLIDLDNIFRRLNLNISDFTYYIVTYTFKNEKVTKLDWNLFGKDFNLLETESLMNLIIPDAIDLTATDYQSNENYNSNNQSSSRKNIKLRLKYDKQKKNGTENNER